MAKTKKLTKSQKNIIDNPDIEFINISDYKKLFKIINTPNYESLTRYTIIPDLYLESIEEVRKDFIEKSIELKHKFENSFWEFRKTWDEILIRTLNVFWNNYNGTSKENEGMKLEYFQCVYLAHRDYLDMLIASIISQYDKIKNSKERAKFQTGVELLSISFKDIKRLFDKQFRSNYLLLENKNAFEKDISVAFNMWKGNPKEKRKRKTDECKRVFIELNYVKLECDNESLSWIYDRIIRGFLFWDKEKKQPKKELLSYSRLCAWKDNRANKKLIDEILASLIKNESKIKEYKKLIEKAHRGTLI